MDVVGVMAAYSAGGACVYCIVFTRIGSLHFVLWFEEKRLFICRGYELGLFLQTLVR